LYFKLGKAIIIEATIQSGLYIVTHIAKGQAEKAYTSNALTNPLSSTQKIKKSNSKVIKKPPKDNLRN
jgi:hypothetical protein